MLNHRGGYQPKNATFVPERVAAVTPYPRFVQQCGRVYGEMNRSFDTGLLRKGPNGIIVTKFVSVPTKLVSFSGRHARMTACSVQNESKLDALVSQ